MAEVEVYMDIPAVRDMSKKFDVIGDVLRTIAKALEVLAMILKTTAFIGLVGGYAVAMVIDRIRPQIEQMGEKCEELARDISDSVDAYERGDQEGAARFH
jgi:hypothetical protein